MGVRMIKKTGKFRAEIKIRGKRFSKNFLTQEDAEAWLKTIKQIQTTHSGSNQHQLLMTVRQAFAILIDLCQRKKFDERTIDSYFEAMRLLEPILDIEITTLTPKDIENTFTKMRHYRTGEYLSKSRTFKTLGKLTRALQIAARRGVVMHNFEEAEASVVGFIENTSPEVISRSPYSIDELQKLLDYKAPEGKEPYWVVPLIKILTMTGKRIGEVLGLTNDKINHDDMTIEISQMVTNGIYKKRLKGKGKAHKLKMDSELSDTIKELQELNNQRCPGSPWLFPPRQYRWVGDFPKKDNCPYKGRPIRRSSADKFLKLRMRGAGVRIISIHGFRKTYATLRAVHLLTSGHRFARDVIRKELNHKRASTTDLYIDIAESYLEESNKVNVLSPLSKSSTEESKTSAMEFLKDMGIDVDKYDWDMLKEILSTVAKLSKKAS